MTDYTLALEIVRSIRATAWTASRAGNSSAFEAYQAAADLVADTFGVVA